MRGTFQNPSKGRYLHPIENRTLSLREGARLQGDPDCWTFAGRPYPVARQIGNGVPVPLARAVAGAIIYAIEVATKEKKAACSSFANDSTCAKQARCIISPQIPIRRTSRTPTLNPCKTRGGG